MRQGERDRVSARVEMAGTETHEKRNNAVEAWYAGKKNRRDGKKEAGIKENEKIKVV